MSDQPAPKESRMQSFGRHVMAAVVLLVCALILLHFAFHLILWLATVVAIIVAIIGAIWAIRVLF
jgi:hypothetical protein